MKKDKLMEMEADMSALEHTIEDWKTALAKFDDDWKNLVSAHDQQRSEFLKQIQFDSNALDELKNVYTRMKIRVLEGEDEYSQYINDYLCTYGITDELLRIIKIIACTKYYSCEIFNCDSNVSNVTLDMVQKFFDDYGTEQCIKTIAEFLRIEEE